MLAAVIAGDYGEPAEFGPHLHAVELAQQQDGALLKGRALAMLISARNETPPCPQPNIKLSAMSAGLMEIVVQSECRRFQSVRIEYARSEFIRTINEAGQLNFILDCFAGESEPVQLLFEDGTRISESVTTLDLQRVTKVAVVWSAPVNLDLHAFEYSALPESPDHIWQGAPLSADAAHQKVQQSGRGHGFLSTSSNGTEPGSKLEVYTFFHDADQKRGVINMALDYESRSRAHRNPDTCGVGLYSELEYEAILLKPGMQPERLFGKFAALDCSKRLKGINRMNQKTVPEIVIRN